jgi:hypothetical protein
MTVLVVKGDLEGFLDGLAGVAFASMLFVDDNADIELSASQVIVGILGALKVDKANGGLFLRSWH